MNATNLLRRREKRQREPLRIVAYYLVFSGLWIILSDRLLATFVPDPQWLTRLQTVKGLVFVGATALLLFWLIRGSHAAAEAKESAIRRIFSGVSAATGDVFFHSLVRHLTMALRCDYALLGVLDPDQKSVTTLAVCRRGETVENFSYRLEGTPCDNVMKSGLCVYPRDVAKLFPHDLLLREMGVAAYLGAPVRDGQGSPIGILVVMDKLAFGTTDWFEEVFTTFAQRAGAELERQRFEAAVSASEERNRALLEAIPDLIFRIDHRGNILDFHAENERDLLLPPDRVIGTSLQQLPIPAEEQQKIWAALQRTLATGELQSVGYALSMPGEKRRFLARLARNGPEEVVAIVEDVTERLRTEEALQEQFAQLATIFDSLNALVYIADMESSELLFVNRFGETLFGSDWRRRPCYEVLQQGQTTACSFCTNDQLVAGGEPQSPCIWEFRNTRNGRWYQCTDKAIRWTDGRLVRMEVAVDITEQKEMDRLKDEMISAVSHEMRTPLTAMIGYIDFLLENEVDQARLQEYLRTVHQQTERLNELIGTILDLQRIRAGGVVIAPAAVDIAPLLDEVRTLCRLDAGKYRLVVDCPTGLPKVSGNREQLLQVLNHLVANAVKFSPDGGTITLGASSENGTVTLWVADEGIGIGGDDLERVFDSFYRVDNTDTRSAGGAGLGLTLVRELVRLHGGKVWAVSRSGMGSTFFVRLSVDQQPGDLG